MTCIPFRLAAVAVALTWTTPAVRAQIATLSIQSQPGDYIGAGQTLTINYPSDPSDLFSAQIRRTLADGSPAELLFVLGHVSPDPNTFALLFFGTDALGIMIQPGVYGLPGNTAERADFAQAGHPGLDVSFQNRGSNTLTGNFTITDASFYTDQTGTLQIGHFAASFEQHSEGATPALFGQFSYTAVPEPSVLTIVGLTAAGLGLRLRRSKLSAGPPAGRSAPRGTGPT